MASRKGPGVAPLGHAPFSKVKLEGPKKSHDFHGNDASRPAKGDQCAIPNKHWEIGYDATDPSRNMILTEGADFNPKQSDMRKTTYIKVNREDH